MGGDSPKVLRKYPVLVGGQVTEGLVTDGHPALHLGEACLQPGPRQDPSHLHEGGLGGRGKGLVGMRALGVRGERRPDVIVLCVEMGWS